MSDRGPSGAETVMASAGGDAILFVGGGPPRARACDAPASPPPPAGWRLRLHRVARALHRILGAPDYDAYLAHHRRAHPDVAPLSYAEFARRRYEERASRTGSRCC